jgi:nucleoside 2-deoxyribosyltransferase
VVVSGGARGVDLEAEGAARARGLAVQIFPADWDKYGKRAGFLRNQQIVDAADTVVAFHDGVSRGTLHTIGLAKAAGKPVRIIL